MHETIPSQILDPFTELCEVGHIISAHGSKPRSSYGLTSALSPRTSKHDHDDPSSSLLRRYREAPRMSISRLSAWIIVE